MTHHRTEIIVQALMLQHLEGEPFAVLKASGELDIDTQDAFRAAVRELLERSSVVVDLSEVDFVAIAALRTLIECHRLATSMGNLLFFAEPTRQMLRLLTLTGLDAVLPVAPSVADVVASPRPIARAAAGA